MPMPMPEYSWDNAQQVGRCHCLFSCCHCQTVFMLEVHGLPGHVFETPKGFTRKQDIQPRSTKYFPQVGGEGADAAGLLGILTN